MVTDGNGNTYILDARNRKIMKFDASINTLETYRSIDGDFDWQYDEDSDSPYSNRYFRNTEFTPMKLVYNEESGNIYIAGIFSRINAWPYERIGLFALYDITSITEIVSFGEVVYPYTDSIKHQLRAIKFIDGSQFYLIVNGDIFEGSIGQATNSLGEYGILLSDNDSTSIVADQNNVYIMMQKWITNEQISPGSSTRITLGNVFEALTDYQGSFYGVWDNAIYEISTSGRIKLYIDLNELSSNYSYKVRISLMRFDNKGNIVFYDEQANSIFMIPLQNK